MSTYFPSPQPSSSLPTCGAIKCNDHGVCVAPPGGGVDLVCDCKLGYRGESCEETVNGSLSVPLTLSVLVVVIGLVSLAFILAKIRRKRKKKHRRHLAAKHGYNVVV